MADARYSKRQVAAARRARRIKEENRRLREFVADLPFNKIILLQELWERQHREIRPKQTLNYEGRR